MYIYLYKCISLHLFHIVLIFVHFAAEILMSSITGCCHRPCWGCYL